MKTDAGPQQNDRGKGAGSPLAKALKWLVTILLCGLIVASSDWGEVARSLTSPAVQRATAAVAALMAVNISLSAWKWKILLRPLGYDLRYPELLRRYYVGTFFSNFLPSTIGGDGYRILSIRQHGIQLERALLPVFLERLSGVSGMLLIGLAAGLLGWGWVSAGMAGTAVAVCAGGLAAIAMLGTLGALLLRSLGGKHRLIVKLKDKVETLLWSMRAYRSAPAAVASALGLSFLFYAIMVTARYLLIDAQGAALQPVEITLAVVLSATAAMLPISINGFGLLDGTFIYLVSRFGVQHEVAVTVMLLHRALMLTHSLLGGLLYATERREQGAVVIEATPTDGNPRDGT